MPAWPTESFPFFVSLNALAGQGSNQVQRTNMARGTTKTRRISSAGPSYLDGATYPMTNAQLIAFEYWFDTTLAGGALSFTACDPTDGLEKTFRFNGPYSKSATGNYRVVSAQLEILV